MVKGNKFITEKNDTILFRGLSIADPDKIEHQGQWNKDLFARIKKLGAMVVRIPVHPIAWRERTVKEYLNLLDQAVEWSTENGLYLDIDWHSIGNLQEDLYQDPMYTTSRAETFNFWRTIAEHFNGNNTVAFLELFNEPTDYRGRLGNASWDEWKIINENLIKMIRAYNMQGIPLVAGFDWAYDLTPLNYAPINAEGIGYITHPYPHKRNLPYEPKWEENFGFAANTYPVIASEIGFTLGAGSISENGVYGKSIIKYLEGKGISWIWWVYDPQWTPNMIESWDTHKLTDCGRFFESAANGNIDK
jgi:aryl-phospho-beta-D-glucosidase BglC (GH1 family)